jgi:hypothetical protein
VSRCELSVRPENQKEARTEVQASDQRNCWRGQDLNLRVMSMITDRVGRAPSTRFPWEQWGFPLPAVSPRSSCLPAFWHMRPATDCCSGRMRSSEHRGPDALACRLLRAHVRLLAPGAGAEEVEAVRFSGEAGLAGCSLEGPVEVGFGAGIEGEVGDITAVRADEVVVVFG